jgi:hypothetical protein
MGGITWTVNADGSVSVSGTATGRSYLELLSTSTKWKMPKGTYILSQSGMPANVTIESGYYSGDSYYAVGPIVPGTIPEREFEVTDILATKVFTLFIDIPATNVGTTFNFTVKPMIRLASITDDTYEPYAMTNKQITDVIPSDASASNKLVTESDINTVTIGNTGTASATEVSYQQVGINGTYTEINGTKYMTIDNTNATSYTFTNSAIKTNSVIDVYSSIWGDVVSSVTANNGSCVVTFSSATTRSVRIYIR